MGHSVYSVSKIISYLRNMVREDLLCRRVTISGEISDVRLHKASGHTYFILREGDDQLSCILYASNRASAGAFPQDGKEMECTGEITFYHKPARFTFRVLSLRFSGEGRIYEEYLKTKQEMEEAGMFSPIYKKKVPRLVRRLGVLSSASGDVRADIESVAKRRNPFIEIVLCPVYVQGEKAIESLAFGIGRILKENVDAIIVARGGGSDADMEVFNSRIVAEAIFNSPVPVISAIGHTPYEPILNLVADMKAGTPSEAAEKAVCDVYALLSDLQNKEAQLQRALGQTLSFYRGCVREQEHLLHRFSAVQTLANKRLQIAAKRELLQTRMEEAIRESRKKAEGARQKLSVKMHESLLTAKTDLSVSIAALEGSSPLKRIKAGYAFVEDESGHGISSVRDLQTGSGLRLYMADGLALATVEEIRSGTLSQLIGDALSDTGEDPKS